VRAVDANRIDSVISDVEVFMMMLRRICDDVARALLPAASTLVSTLFASSTPPVVRDVTEM